MTASVKPLIELTHCLENGPFDPAAGLFVAQARRPAGLEPVDPAALSPQQRALLVIDGTVTTFLEAWALEPIVVSRLWQRSATLRAAEYWLDARAGDPVIERAVLLAGRRTGRFFAFAESLICPDRLPAALADTLATGDASLGQLLLTPGFDSRREGLWYGRERLQVLPQAVAAVTAGDFLTRSYRVTAAGRPLMIISERFPFTPEPT